MSRPDDVPGRDSNSRIVPAPYPSRRSLAQALDMAESTVDEMVRRGVLPPPIKLSTGCVRWCWADVETALASLKVVRRRSPRMRLWRIRTFVGFKMSQGSRRGAVALPKGVHRVIARGREYFYYQANAGTPRAGARVVLPHDPHSPEFWIELRKAQGIEHAAPAVETFGMVCYLYEASPIFARLHPAHRPTTITR